jgi:hypothetical protein
MYCTVFYAFLIGLVGSGILVFLFFPFGRGGIETRLLVWLMFAVIPPAASALPAGIVGFFLAGKRPERITNEGIAEDLNAKECSMCGAALSKWDRKAGLCASCQAKAKG